MRIVPDHITNPFERLPDAPMLWIVLGIVAGAAVTVVLIVLLKKKKGGK